MADRQSIEAFLQGPGPVVDVRAPGEFDKGHIPGAQNLPLFSDEERAEVGTSYSSRGALLRCNSASRWWGQNWPSLGRRCRHSAEAIRGNR